MSDVLKRFDSVLSSVTKETERICGEVYGCLKEHPRQFDPPIYDYVHGGIYSRTMFLPKGTMIMGALIKVPTTLVISGSCFVSDGIKIQGVNGYCTIFGEPNRRSIFYAYEDTYVTMLCKVTATNTKDAEKEFTDEWELLTTNKENK